MHAFIFRTALKRHTTVIMQIPAIVDSAIIIKYRFTNNDIKIVLYKNVRLLRSMTLVFTMIE